MPQRGIPSIFHNGGKEAHLDRQGHHMHRSARGQRARRFSDHSGESTFNKIVKKDERFRIPWPFRHGQLKGANRRWTKASLFRHPPTN